MKLNLVLVALALVVVTGCSKSGNGDGSSSTSVRNSPQGEKVYVGIPGNLGESRTKVTNLMRELMRPKGMWKSTPIWLNFDEFSVETRQIFSAPVERADFSRGTFATVVDQVSEKPPADEYLDDALERVASMLEQTTADQPVRAYIVTTGISADLKADELEAIKLATTKLGAHRAKLAQLCIVGVVPENRKATTDILAQSAPDKVKVATWADEEWRRCL
jgi:hypothetical protein